MKQIGARQEAGRIGGIGACGRELCCASWISSFSSVTTNAARVQDISLNPQKLAGQCSKLKCCLMYEYDVYAETFRIRIEMKQIGARQEAGRIGGTGPCGRELCCSTWMTQFTSVGTTAARVQNISLNPQKLAGQCAKLKCCLNYEMPIYEEAAKKMPSRNIHLETKDAIYYLFSTDPLKGEVTYSTDPHHVANLESISVKRAHEIIEMNRRGEKPLTLGGKQSSMPVIEVDYQNVVGQDDLTRFDKKKNNKNNHGRNHGHNHGNEKQNNHRGYEKKPGNRNR
jgi:cell fate regulator YaaT (PSP1 superfamily)